MAVSEKVLEVFKKFDQDQSGSIDKEELSQVLKALDENFNNADLDKMLLQADASGDGELSVEEFLRWIFAEEAGKLGINAETGFTLVISGCPRTELNGEYVQQDQYFFCRRPVFFCAENKRMLFYQKKRGSWQIYWRTSMKASARVKTKRAPHTLQGQETWACWMKRTNGKKGFVKQPEMKCQEPPPESLEERVARAPEVLFADTDDVACELTKQPTDGARPSYVGEGCRCFYDQHRWKLEVDGNVVEESMKTSVCAPHMCLWADGVSVSMEMPQEPLPDDGGKWEDPDFPCVDESIGEKFVKRYERYGGVIWKRLPEIYPDAVLFDEDDPFDCDQGWIGNCWLVAQIASMGEYRTYLTEKIFQTNELSPTGKYDIRLYDTTIRDWATFSVDDRVPVQKNGTPIFLRSHGSLWPILLEKTFAKISGKCYWNLDGRSGSRECINPTQAMMTLLGGDVFGHVRKAGDKAIWLTQVGKTVTTECDPESEVKGELFPWCTVWEEEMVGKRMRYTILEHQKKEEQFVPGTEEGWISTEKDVILSTAAGWTWRKYQIGPETDWYKASACNQTILEEVGNISEDAMFQKMLEFDQNQCLTTVSDSQKTKRTDGLVPFHAYTLLHLQQVGEFKMCCLRNPWGRSEWNGRWSDGSDEWDAHPEVAQALVAEEDNDGMFWMEFRDFQSIFCEICINSFSEPPPKKALFHAVLDDEDVEE